jgi:single-strand DNA-binding protein
MWGSANFIRTAGNSSQPGTGQGQQGSPAGAERDHIPGAEEPEDAGVREEDDEDPDPAAEGIFIDDQSGDVLQLDSDTGELTGAAA